MQILLENKCNLSREPMLMLPDRYVQTCSVRGMLGYIKGGPYASVETIKPYEPI